MRFPETLKDLKRAILAKEKSENAFAKFRQSALEEADRHRRSEEQCRRFVLALKRLLASWKNPEPGKNDDAYFFLREYQRVVVHEFLDPGDAPPAYPIVPLVKVWHHACHTCGGPQPVIEHCGPVYGASNSDRWVKEYLVICPGCNVIEGLAVQRSDHPF